MVSVLSFGMFWGFSGFVCLIILGSIFYIVSLVMWFLVTFPSYFYSHLVCVVFRFASPVSPVGFCSAVFPGVSTLL